MPSNSIQLRHPVVLVHGLGAQCRYGPVDYFFGLPARLRAAGNTVLAPNLTAFHTIEHRSAELRRALDLAAPEAKFNLVGHSFGGLDIRYLATQPGFTARVASVTTVGAPNRGTTICDIAAGLVPDDAFRAVEWLLSALGSSARAYQQMTTRYCADVLAARAPQAQGVAYFSATSVIRSPVMRTALPLFWIPHRVIRRYEGANDGFVSEHSARWGEHISTVYGDHYGQIGQFLGRSRGCDYIGFYDTIFSRLAREGF